MTPIDPHFLSGGGAGDYHGKTPCPACGYDLRGLPIGSTCPECGASPVTGEEFEESNEEVVDPRFLHRPDTADRISPPADEEPSARRCGGCGYDLQGLASVGRCPECGLDFDSKRERAAARSTLLPPAVANSSRWRWGLLLTILAVAGYVGFGLLGLFPSDLPVHELGTIASLLAWAGACWLAVPFSVAGGSKVWSSIRVAACSTQPLWVAAYVITWVMNATSLHPMTVGLIGVLSACAAAGLFVLLIMLCRMASDLYFRDTARLLGYTVWLLIPIALIDWLFPWPSPGGEALFDAQFNMLGTIVLMVVLLPLFIIPLVVGLASLQFLNFSLWSARQARRRAGREDRIRAKKQTLQEQAMDDRPVLATCDACGAALVGGSCPACNPAEPPSDIPLA